MIRIGIVGDIGSGKTFVANNFGYPVFSADLEVAKIYKKNKKIFLKLKKELPKHITKFPIDKIEISNAILSGKKNLSKIIKNKGLSTSVGDEGGFAPMISNNNQALDLIKALNITNKM